MTHAFVEYIPRHPAEGVLYVSIPYCTVVHKCPCGCGNKVVAPITPADWQLVFDGETVSLTPSIGNWSSACRSHYWITSDKIHWAGAWTDEQIARGRARDDRGRAKHFTPRAGNESDPLPDDLAKHQTRPRLRPAWLRRVLHLRNRS